MVFPQMIVQFHVLILLCDDKRGSSLSTERKTCDVDALRDGQCDRLVSPRGAIRDEIRDEVQVGSPFPKVEHAYSVHRWKGFILNFSLPKGLSYACSLTRMLVPT